MASETSDITYLEPLSTEASHPTTQDEMILDVALAFRLLELGPACIGRVEMKMPGTRKHLDYPT